MSLAAVHTLGSLLTWAGPALGCCCQRFLPPLVGIRCLLFSVSLCWLHRVSACRPLARCHHDCLLGCARPCLTLRDAVDTAHMSGPRCSLTDCNQRKHSGCAQVQCVPDADALHWLQIERAGDTRHSLREEAAAVLAAVLQASMHLQTAQSSGPALKGAAEWTNQVCTVQRSRLSMTP